MFGSKNAEIFDFVDCMLFCTVPALMQFRQVEDQHCIFTWAPKKGLRTCRFPSPSPQDQKFFGRGDGARLVRAIKSPFTISPRTCYFCDLLCNGGIRHPDSKQKCISSGNLLYFAEKQGRTFLDLFVIRTRKLLRNEQVS